MMVDSLLGSRNRIKLDSLNNMLYLGLIQQANVQQDLGMVRFWGAVLTTTPKTHWIVSTV